MPHKEYPWPYPDKKGLFLDTDQSFIELFRKVKEKEDKGLGTYRSLVASTKEGK
ncbi:MAG: hypothetical protein V3R28_00075 [Desulfatiglandales bacterium]